VVQEKTAEGFSVSDFPAHFLPAECCLDLPRPLLNVTLPKRVFTCRRARA
jgi:hypothetical protein